MKLAINPFLISSGRYQLDPGVPSYTPTPLVSEKVVRTLLVVWNFGAPNATPCPSQPTSPRRATWPRNPTGPEVGFCGNRPLVHTNIRFVNPLVHTFKGGALVRYFYNLQRSAVHHFSGG
jgi:hypothetical protein